MIRPLLCALLLGASLATAGCGVTPCDAASICGVDQNGKLCDGSSYLACDDAHRGTKVICGGSRPAAVCTTGGWTFQSN